MTTLLQEAATVVPRRMRQTDPVSDEQIELAIEYFAGKIRAAQVAKVLKIGSHNVHNVLGSVIGRAYVQGHFVRRRK